jgi:hypothetical protein
MLKKMLIQEFQSRAGRSLEMIELSGEIHTEKS